MSDIRGIGTKSLKNSLKTVIKPILKSPKFTFIYTLVANWDKIFNIKYSKYFALEKVSILNEGRQCNIVISSYNSAASFYLNNNILYILDIVNSMFGYQAVLKISVKEVPKII